MADDTLNFLLAYSNLAMLQFGICTREDLRQRGKDRRRLGTRIAYTLLDVGDTPGLEEIEEFEDICFTLRLSNGTFRTSYRNRFADVNAMMAGILAASYSPAEALYIQDRAVSHGLTAYEWAKTLLSDYPLATYEASDLMLELAAVTSPGGTTYVSEPDGTVIQGITPPFVVATYHREPYRYPINSLVSIWLRWRFKSLSLPDDWTSRESIAGLKVRRVPLVHPEARAYQRREPRFQIVNRSVFDITPSDCHVLRTMNILNRAYFSESRLEEGIRAAFSSVAQGGFWVIGRTTEDSFENHASILRRAKGRWELAGRVGRGSEIEDLIFRAALA